MFAPGSAATLVLTPLTSTSPAKARDPRFAELPSRLGDIFGESGTMIVEERDLVAPAGPGTWVLRIQLGEIRSEGARGERAVHSFEVSVLDASGAPLERVATDAGIVLMIDTAGRPPILRETYEITVETDYGSHGLNREEENAYNDEFRALLAELLYEELAPDLERAIASAVPFVQPVGAVPSSGGETPMVIH